MRVLLSAPRYERILPWVEDFLFDFTALASHRGHAIMRLPAASQHHLFIEQAREVACTVAIQHGLDAVLMTDADCCVSPEDGVRLLEDAVSGDWTMLTAPISMRTTRGSAHFYQANWSLAPWPERAERTPEEVAEELDAIRRGVPLRVKGYAGTGVCVLSPAKVATLGPSDWWARMPKDPSQGLTEVPGVDVSFCRRAIPAGHRVGVHMGIRSGRHWDLGAIDTEGMLRAIEAGLSEGKA